VSPENRGALQIDRWVGPDVWQRRLYLYVRSPCFDAELLVWSLPYDASERVSLGEPNNREALSMR